METKLSGDRLPGIRFFIAGLALLSSITALKASDVQSAEIFGLFVLLVSLAHVRLHGWIIRGDGVTLGLLRRYGAFLVATILLGFLALRLPEFPLVSMGPFKRAPILTVARVVQMSVSIWGFYLIATLIQRRPSLINVATQFYVYAGLLNAVYGLASWLALKGGIELGGAYGSDNRIRGFFVEGGPFGVYLVSVVLVCLFRFAVLKRLTVDTFIAQIAVLGCAFFLSSSKASYLLVVSLTLYCAFATRRWMAILLIVIPAALVISLGTVSTSLSSYAANYVRIEQAALERPDDNNLVMGRIMASLLLPRMIVDHPVTGVGLGNYSLQRNNPEYLRGLPTTDYWDLPGLGLFGYMAELGIPLCLYLCWLLWRPVSYGKAVGAGFVLTALCGYQFFAHFFGVQLTFMYPWLISGMALGYCQAQRHESTLAVRGLPLPARSSGTF